MKTFHLLPHQIFLGPLFQAGAENWPSLTNWMLDAGLKATLLTGPGPAVNLRVLAPKAGLTLLPPTRLALKFGLVTAFWLNLPALLLPLKLLVLKLLLVVVVTVVFCFTVTALFWNLALLLPPLNCFGPPLGLAVV